MGNQASVAAAGTEENNETNSATVRMSKEEEPLARTWAQVRDAVRGDEEDADEDNGYILSGIYVPEVALEVLLSWVPVEQLLKLSVVCRAWKEMTTRRSFWKLVCQRNGVPWEGIPEHVKDKETAWMVFYAAARNQVLTKNFVKNHSGHDRFNNWVIVRSGGGGFSIESPPVGITPLPRDPRFEGLNDSAFVTSFQWCTKLQRVDLWEAGLTPAVMMTMIPFEFFGSEMVGSRFDCGGLYRLTLTLESSDNSEDSTREIASTSTEGARASGDGWAAVSTSLLITEQHRDQLAQARYLVLRNDGKDNQFWAGHYGTKFSRISLSTRLLTDVEVERKRAEVQPDSGSRAILEDPYDFL